MQHASKGQRAIPLKGIPKPSPESLLAVALSDNVQVSSDQIVVAIPVPLLTAISEEGGLKSARDAIVMVEAKLVDLCAPHRCAGIWHSRPVSTVSLLPDMPIAKVSKEQARTLGWDVNEAKLSHQIRIANERTAYFSKIARGIAGWLLTNPQFLDEHDALLGRWRKQIEARARRRELLLLAELGMVRSIASDISENGFDEDVVKFLVRWRLLKLAGPELPEPLRPMLAGLFPISIVQQLIDAGGLFNIPDTFPIPSRDELRGVLQDALRPDEDVGHLAEWHKIVQGQNLAKNQIDRYARVRQVYCFWRSLHQRHAKSLHRKVEPLRRVFAKYLHVSEQSIKSDLSLIASRLGKSWCERQSA